MKLIQLALLLLILLFQNQLISKAQALYATRTFLALIDKFRSMLFFFSTEIKPENRVFKSFAMQARSN